MRTKIYNLLVNKQPGIAYRYYKVHDGSTGMLKILSWAYLLCLNLFFYVFFCRFIGKIPDIKIYEEKKLNISSSESQSHVSNLQYHSVSDYINKLSQYDVISFDVFDTLIFRPFSQPTDLFYFIGQKLGIMNFKNLRIQAEYRARMKCCKTQGHMEISLSDIWKELEAEVGNAAKGGMEIEVETEKQFCYANPFMLQVWNALIEQKKDVVIVSDMYLPKEVIEEILLQNGFIGAKQVFISNEYKKNKAKGALFEEVKAFLEQEYPQEVSMIHVGDNPNSDWKMAKQHGFDIYPYANTNKNALLYRPMDMSYIIGGAYRGLVSNHLYNGKDSYSLDYEYGYLYGGLFVLGYCAFIHEYVKLHQIEKILFLSRDGDTLIQAYRKMYLQDNVSYVYWSRKAALKLMADEDRHDYFRRFLYHKINKNISLTEILESMELERLLPDLNQWISKKPEDNKNGEFLLNQKLRATDSLTDNNVDLLKLFLLENWERIVKIYEPQQKAAKKYYERELQGIGKAVAVDIGWAGSGAIALSHLINKVWGMDCELTGMIAGTNTIYNPEPDASETFLQDGSLVSYLYSSSFNRDLLKKHNPSKDYNVYWELLLSSPTPQFAGFYEGDELRFGKEDYNQDGIREIQRGILDFVDQYMEHFGNPEGEYSFMYRISGRDAYAPMLVAASHNEAYLKMIESRYRFEISVN